MEKPVGTLTLFNYLHSMKYSSRGKIFDGFLKAGYESVRAFPQKQQLKLWTTGTGLKKIRENPLFISSHAIHIF